MRPSACPATREEMSVSSPPPCRSQTTCVTRIPRSPRASWTGSITCGAGVGGDRTVAADLDAIRPLDVAWPVVAGLAVARAALARRALGIARWPVARALGRGIRVPACRAVATGAARTPYGSGGSPREAAVPAPAERACGLPPAVATGLNQRPP